MATTVCVIQWPIVECTVVRFAAQPESTNYCYNKPIDYDYRYCRRVHCADAEQDMCVCVSVFVCVRVGIATRRNNSGVFHKRPDVGVPQIGADCSATSRRRRPTYCRSCNGCTGHSLHAFGCAYWSPLDRVILASWVISI